MLVQKADGHACPLQHGFCSFVAIARNTAWPWIEGLNFKLHSLPHPPPTSYSTWDCYAMVASFSSPSRVLAGLPMYVCCRAFLLQLVYIYRSARRQLSIDPWTRWTPANCQESDLRMRNTRSLHRSGRPVFHISRKLGAGLAILRLVGHGELPIMFNLWVAMPSVHYYSVSLAYHP